jgi:hypothetical protein
MEDEEAWLKDSLARAVKVLGKAGQSPRVIRRVEEPSGERGGCE